MRRLAVVVVLIVFASLNAMDGIGCADGCTHEEQASSPLRSDQERDGMCVLCVGGINGPDAEMLAAVALLANRVAGAPQTPASDVPPEPPEHPPRS